MDTAYVSENPPQKYPYKVQYLQFRYLKFLVIILYAVSLISIALFHIEYV